MKRVQDDYNDINTWVDTDVLFVSDINLLADNIESQKTLLDVIFKRVKHSRPTVLFLETCKYQTGEFMALFKTLIDSADTFII